jgi:uncharacterized membrane protein YfhO
MKKAKQILAILGIVLILGLNVLLIFGAGSATEDDTTIFNAAIVSVILVPVLLWIYLYIYKLIKNHNKDKEEQHDNE